MFDRRLQLQTLQFQLRHPSGKGASEWIKPHSAFTTSSHICHQACGDCDRPNNIWHGGLLAGEKVGPVFAVALIILAYVLGHISNLLFRPVGLLFIIGAIRRLVDAGFKREQVITATGKLDLDLNAHPWERLIWDPLNRRMLVSGENGVVAEHILVYGLTRDEKLIGQSERALRKEWAGLVGQRSSRAVTLPGWPKLARHRSRV
jgi:hypothetical protein